MDTLTWSAQEASVSSWDQSRRSVWTQSFWQGPLESEHDFHVGLDTSHLMDSASPFVHRDGEAATLCVDLDLRDDAVYAIPEENLTPICHIDGDASQGWVEDIRRHTSAFWYEVPRITGNALLGGGVYLSVSGHIEKQEAMILLLTQTAVVCCPSIPLRTLELTFYNGLYSADAEPWELVFEWELPTTSSHRK